MIYRSFKTHRRIQRFQIETWRSHTSLWMHDCSFASKHGRWWLIQRLMLQRPHIILIKCFVVIQIFACSSHHHLGNSFFRNAYHNLGKQVTHHISLRDRIHHSVLLEWMVRSRKKMDKSADITKKGSFSIIFYVSNYLHNRFSSKKYISAHKFTLHRKIQLMNSKC